MKDNFFNREISWLHFNERVLQEALDPRNPLLERVKFLGIFSSNRDEFFKVRVATVKRLIKLNQKHHPQHANKFTALLKEILDFVGIQEERYTAAFKSLRKELVENKIHLVNETEIDSEQGIFIQNLFREEIRPIIFPIILDKFRGASKLRDKAIYLAISMKDSRSIAKERYALIQVPTNDYKRFVALPTRGDKHYVMFLEDIIRYNLSEIFSIYGYDEFHAYIIKFTRDAELDIDNDVSKSFLELMSESVKKRKKGNPVRFVYDREMPKELLNKILKKLNIDENENQLRAGGRYHNFKDFMDFPALDKSMVFEKMKPIPHPALPINTSVFGMIKKQDILLHFPYHPFQHIIDFLREASIDPQVKSIKMTFYRAARNSKLMNALVNAARNGKTVTVFIELQARFDEEANIFWAKKLQSEGVKVLPTIPGIKVHAKTILVRRKEKDEQCYYANISTGNFNESTAKIYSDLSLLTCNKLIANDIKNIFELFESRYLPPKFEALWVSPFSMRSFLNQKIEQEIHNSLQGLPSEIVIKANSFVDQKIAKKMYEANNAGVSIRLLLRGSSVLKTGLSGLSENMESRSIVGRYLEHARIFIFKNGGNPEYYISSADVMSRNLDHRFEVACPIFDAKIQKEIDDLVALQWSDNVKARHLDYDKLNQYVEKNSEEVNSQQILFSYYSNQEI